MNCSLTSGSGFLKGEVTDEAQMILVWDPHGHFLRVEAGELSLMLSL